MRRSKEGHPMLLPSSLLGNIVGTVVNTIGHKKKKKNFVFKKKLKTYLF